MCSSKSKRYTLNVNMSILGNIWKFARNFGTARSIFYGTIRYDTVRYWYIKSIVTIFTKNILTQVKDQHTNTFCENINTIISFLFHLYLYFTNLGTLLVFHNQTNISYTTTTQYVLSYELNNNNNNNNNNNKYKKGKYSESIIIKLSNKIKSSNKYNIIRCHFFIIFDKFTIVY